MAKDNKSPHRLSHAELPAGGLQPLGTFGKGDVVVRQGAPVMVVDPRNSIDLVEGQTWVCNLQTGSVWPLPNTEQVWPCTDVQLTFKSMRREF